MVNTPMPRPFVHKNEWDTSCGQLSFPRPFILGNFRSLDHSFLGNFRFTLLLDTSFRGTFIHRSNFRSPTAQSNSILWVCTNFSCCTIVWFPKIKWWWVSLFCVRVVFFPLNKNAKCIRSTVTIPVNKLTQAYRSIVRLLAYTVPCA